MATMVKEKHREKKKKPKEKPSSSVPIEIEVPLPAVTHEQSTSSFPKEHVLVSDQIVTPTDEVGTKNTENTEKSREQTPQPSTSVPMSIESPTRDDVRDDLNRGFDSINISYDTVTSSPDLSHFEINSSPEISSGLKENVNSEPSFKDQFQSTEMSKSGSVLEENLPLEPSITDQIETTALVQDACPSAPIFDEPCREQMFLPNLVQPIASKTRPKLQCMPLEEAARLFGGAEMTEVHAMSEREEAIVEAGPTSGPEHPLVDLLSTFRCSLKAVERVRAEIVRGYREEEIFRAKLWKVETRRGSATQKCPCGLTVDLLVRYEHAELQKAQLPTARMRLEALAREVRDSYCHHQHLALLTHCQIEELVVDTVQSSKNHIREALALVLQELKVADSAPPALATALQRWARKLAAALVDARDLRQLLFVLHYLCRQNRSVRWAARLVRVSAGDNIEAARVIALLELLLCGHMARVDAALECTEERDEAWEEVDARGGAGAVADGALRERDLLALLRALPRPELLARLALFRQTDVSSAAESEWGDASGGRGVLKAACGARVLLATLRRAAAAHAQYGRLLAALLRLAVHAAHALADLHLHTRATYLRELEPQITAELEATFAAAFELLLSARAAPLQLPFRLLPPAAAMAYCIGLVILLHETEPKRLDGTDAEVPAWLGCALRVRIVAHCCADRTDDYDLARNVLEFLFQTGVKPKSTSCKGGCEAAARESLPDVLRAHPLLYPAALHILADLHQVEHLDPSSVTILAPQQWRPTPQDVHMVLTDWALRCADLLPTLLLSLDYTPHSGVALASQLAAGAWLCEHQRSLPEPPEWAWRVLRRLRTHRAWWAGPLEAPPPAGEGGLFVDAFNLLATDWGHCVPVICSRGVQALRRLAAAGRARDAAHCLAPALLAMAPAADSVSATPLFGTVVSLLLECGPTLVQRALRRGAEAGSALLHKTITRQLARGPSNMWVGAWLHALWPCAGAGAGAALLEAVALSSEPALLASHVEALQAPLAHATRTERVRSLVRNAASCPCACAAALAWLASAQAAGGVWAALLDALQRQRALGGRIHVDNAMKQTGWSSSSEELAIHQTAAAAAAAPARSPGQLALWLLFFQLYLQRPPADMRNTTAPVGPLFFSGISKSRTLVYLKRRLQESADFHQAEITRLRAEEKKLQPIAPPRRNDLRKQTDNSPPALDDEYLKPEVLVAEVSDSDESSGSESDGAEDVENTEPPPLLKRLQDLILFHCEAELITKTYVTWLEEGEKVRALPHSLRPLTERAYQAACTAELERMQPPSSPDDDDAPFTGSVTSAPPVTSPPSPFQRVVLRLSEYKAQDTSSRRRRARSAARAARAARVAAPAQREEPRGPRALLAAVDAHLRALEALAEEWRRDVALVWGADAALWGQLRALRERRPLPAQRKACRNQCRPLLLCVQADEWPISPGAERAIQENRASARAAVRRLARPRADAARTAAALHSICRQVREAETATRVLERAWRCGGGAGLQDCAPARAALSALVDDLAERWIRHDAGRCRALVEAWSGAAAGADGLQRELAAALLAPRRLAPAAWLEVYTTLLTLNTAPHAAFSYLSKFEISRWAGVATPEQRRAALEALTAAAQAHGPAPDAAHTMLLELIGVHTGALIDAQSLCEVCLSCARASAAARLPPAHWPHVLRAADACAEQVQFDELGHTLRELGATWWAARGEGARETERFVAYAAHTAKLIHTLLFAFVAAAHSQRYSVERVAYYGWCALQQAWSPWVTPDRRAALLPPASSAAALPPQQVCRSLVALLQAVAGAEDTVLQWVLEWACGLSPRAGRAALLGELATLPWRRGGWLAGRAVPPLAQTCSGRDPEAWAWCGAVVRGARAGCWLRGVPDDHMAPHLAAVFFVATTLPLDDETIEDVTQLPWWRLPEAAMEPALERFFRDHHDVATPYHQLPQFKLVLYASELSVQQPPPPGGRRAAARDKRLAAVSLWVRAAAAPALQAHVARAARHLLHVITGIAPCLASEDGEVEELLSRAVTILCTEPAGALSLPVWEQWVSGAPAPLVLGCVSAAAALTALEPCAALADAALRALLLLPQSPGWGSAARRWAGSHWRSAAAMATRSRLHAAYVATLAHAQAAADVRATLTAVAAGSFNFVDSEPILALFACYACRIARQTGRAAGGGGGGDEDCAAAAEALLASWAEPKRRSLLKALTLQADTDRPTDKLRLLCQFAQCVLSPGAARARAFEAACAAAGAGADVAGWPRAPHPRRLPRLAARLYPASEPYFSVELDLAPDE